MSRPSGDAATTSATADELPTKQRLLRAAEKLFATNGIGRTSTRAILREAGQRNESALQYHFGGRDGLIEALYAARGKQVNVERLTMLDEVREAGNVDVRQLCEIALMPPVRIARRQPDFVLFLKVVGQLAFLPYEKLKADQTRYELDSIAKLGRQIRGHLDLPGPLVERRLELIHRMATLSLSQRARAGEPFEGPEADVFFDTLLDAMAAVLAGPLSSQTKRSLSRASAKPRKKKRSVR